ncbi:ribonuclease III [Candidatus Liberibacter sp.]|uniref:ribonuclease III n=1 Tax=Candidatus Liberibacter sp. TaxID=34022 RepID=UPI0015F5DDB8|nr:ribonuclease III [Candidatus Liberibacter sp.]MBA5723996.1 ribonuclease III [Candidatus Liberibacter sp.]
MMFSNISAKIEKQIGYVFTNKNLLKTAMTHSGICQSPEGNYQRLEFLGDRVLGLLVAQLLYHNFDSSKVGELAIRYDHLVGREVCAQITRDLKLHKFMLVNRDFGRGICNSLPIQSDLIESLISAIYLDGGLEAANCFVEKNWKSRALSLKLGEFHREPKSVLQSWVQVNFGNILPIYKVTSRSGPDHDPYFTVVVEIPGLLPGTGMDRSKRGAEKIAAIEVLKREGIWKE